MGNQSAPWCVDNWNANGRVPMGVPAFQKAFGVPFQLYAPYFCSDTTYLENWTMVRSDTTLPGCQVWGVIVHAALALRKTESHVQNCDADHPVHVCHCRALIFTMRPLKTRAPSTKTSTTLGR
jgi:hypothetical protein